MDRFIELKNQRDFYKECSFYVSKPYIRIFIHEKERELSEGEKKYMNEIIYSNDNDKKLGIELKKMIIKYIEDEMQERAQKAENEANAVLNTIKQINK